MWFAFPRLLGPSAPTAVATTVFWIFQLRAERCVSFYLPVPVGTYLTANDCKSQKYVDLHVCQSKRYLRSRDCPPRWPSQDSPTICMTRLRDFTVIGVHTTLPEGPRFGRLHLGIDYRWSGQPVFAPSATLPPILNTPWDLGAARGTQFGDNHSSLMCLYLKIFSNFFQPLSAWTGRSVLEKCVRRGRRTVRSLDK